LNPGFASLVGLLPADVAVEEAYIDAVAGVLWPEESACLANASTGRRAEFAAGRILARRALVRLGGPDFAIPVGRDRAPVWPPGFTGSITHCRNHVAVAIGATDSLRGVGIDVEATDRFRPELEDRVLSLEEIGLNLHDLAPEARQVALAVLFSVKEAFYKCQYEITRQFLGFLDVTARIDMRRGRFEITLLKALPLLSSHVFHGGFRVENGMVAAAMVIRR
jgi:4'-phosphopantetheinyl transferase EntD